MLMPIQHPALLHTNRKHRKNWQDIGEQNDEKMCRYNSRLADWLQCGRENRERVI